MKNKAWTVAISYIFPNRNGLKAIEIIKKLDGLFGVNPEYPRGTLLLFKSENDAKIARNILKSKGIQAGDYIGECEFEERKQKLEIW